MPDYHPAEASMPSEPGAPEIAHCITTLTGAKITRLLPEKSAGGVAVVM